MLRYPFAYRGARTLAMLATIVTLLGAFVLTAPEAKATDEPEFAQDVMVADGEACPEATQFAGRITSGILAGTWCRPIGFVPVVTQAGCDASPIFALFFEDIVCFWRGGPQPLAQPCQAPSIRVTGTIRGVETTGCVLAVLERGAVTSRRHTLSQPVCIEDAIVQESAAAEDLRAGNEFHNEGVRYRIIAGGPSCSFNCLDGFDMNCDGKVGDYCAIELDPSRVKDAALCLASLSKDTSAATIS